MAYIDDGGVIGLEEDLVNQEQDAIACAVRTSGLALHPEKSHHALPVWERVGVLVDGDEGIVQPKPARLLRLRAATTAFLERKTVRTLHLQVLLGYYIHMFTLRRPLLSIMSVITGLNLMMAGVPLVHNLCVMSCLLLSLYCQWPSPTLRRL